MKQKTRSMLAFLLILCLSAGLPCGYASAEGTQENEEEIFHTEELKAYQFGDIPQEEEGRGRAASRRAGSGLEEYLYEELLDHNYSVDISKYEIGVDERSVIRGVLDEHPDLYFVSGQYSYYSKNGIITKILFSYNDYYDKVAFKRAEKAALRLVNPMMSDLEKAIVLHDYLVTSCEYDLDNYNAGTIPAKSYTAYGALVDHVAVCNGYALAYKYLLNQLGIDCYMVSSSSMNHAWNLVRIDGAFYQVDVTWDDPVADQLGRCIHRYFLCSDGAFEKHHDWIVKYGGSTVNIRANDTKYDHAFWKDSRSALVFHNNDCYYVSNTSSSIQKTSLSRLNDKGTVFKSLKTDTSNGYYRAAGSSGLFAANDRLFYNMPNAVCSINFDGSDDRIEWSLPVSSEVICGIALKGSAVYYITRAGDGSSGMKAPVRADAVEIKKPRTYTVTFDLQGRGTVLPDYLSYTEMEAGEKMKKPREPKADYYWFSGWYKDAACEDPWDFSADEIESDITLYAKWTLDAPGNWNAADNGGVFGVLEGSGDAANTDVYGSRLLAVHLTAYNTMMLSWNTVPGAASYEIFYSTSPDAGFKRLANTKKTFYKFSKAKCGVMYYFQMRVCTKNAKSEFGPTSYGKTNLIGASVLQVKKTAYNSITLKWSKVAGAKKYEIFCMDSIRQKWESLGLKGGTSFTHKKLVTGATYYYQIRPVRDSFYGSWSNSVYGTTVFSMVTNLKAKAAGADRIRLTWKKVKGAAEYVILRSDSADGTYEAIGISGRAAYMDTGLKSGTAYFYKIYAVSGPYRTKETKPAGQTTRIAK